MKKKTFLGNNIHVYILKIYKTNYYKWFRAHNHTPTCDGLLIKNVFQMFGKKKYFLVNDCINFTMRICVKVLTIYDFYEYIFALAANAHIIKELRLDKIFVRKYPFFYFA